MISFSENKKTYILGALFISTFTAIAGTYVYLKKAEADAAILGYPHKEPPPIVYIGGASKVSLSPTGHLVFTPSKPEQKVSGTENPSDTVVNSTQPGKDKDQAQLQVQGQIDPLNQAAKTNPDQKTANNTSATTSDQSAQSDNVVGGVSLKGVVPQEKKEAGNGQAVAGSVVVKNPKLTEVTLPSSGNVFSSDSK